MTENIFFGTMGLFAWKWARLVSSRSSQTFTLGQGSFCYNFRRIGQQVQKSDHENHCVYRETMAIKQ
jgi:hypothetical protein